MAKTTVVTVTVTSDLGGEGEATNHVFAYEGKTYEIDLNREEGDEFYVLMQKYVAASRRVSTATTSQPRSGTNAPIRKDTKHIREWLRANGEDISERGRIPLDKMEKYNAAHSGGRAPQRPAEAAAIVPQEEPAAAEVPAGKPATGGRGKREARVPAFKSA